MKPRSVRTSFEETESDSSALSPPLQQSLPTNAGFCRDPTPADPHRLHLPHPPARVYNRLRHRAHRIAICHQGQPAGQGRGLWVWCQLGAHCLRQRQRERLCCNIRIEIAHRQNSECCDESDYRLCFYKYTVVTALDHLDLTERPASATHLRTAPSIPLAAPRPL